MKRFAAMVVGILLGTAAMAAGAAPESGAPSVPLVLSLLVLISAAYLLAHFVVDNLQKRFLFTSGFEYIVLGMLLGPFVFSPIHMVDNLTQLTPVIAFAAGWIGLLYGMEFEIKGLLSRSDDMAIRLSLVEALVTGLTVTGMSYLAFTQGWLLDAPRVAVGHDLVAGAAAAAGLAMALPPGIAEAVAPAIGQAALGVARETWVSNDQAMLAAGMLGCAATAGSSSAVDLLTRKYDNLQTQLLPMLRRAARFGDLLAILATGLLFAIFHRGETNTVNPPAMSDWILLTGGLGIGLGALFAMFLGNDRSENNRFLALVGIIVFASGAAFFLNLSPITVNLLLGMVLVNTRQGAGVRETLQTSLRPAGLILLVFAGALWEPVPWVSAVVATASYIALRAVAKAIGGVIASAGTTMRRDIFRGLMAQGEVALAIVLSFRLVYDGPAVSLAYTAVLGAVVVNELSAPRLLKGLLVDAGELDRDVQPVATGS